VKNIGIGQQGSLQIHLAIHQFQGATMGQLGVSAPCVQHPLKLQQPQAQLLREGPGRFNQVGAVVIAAVGEQGGEQGNAEAASQLAGEVVKRPAAIDLLGGQVSQGARLNGRTIKTVPIPLKINDQNRDSLPVLGLIPAKANITNEVQRLPAVITRLGSSCCTFC